MGFPDLFKLEKLTIEAFSDPERMTSVGKTEAMFNPTTINQHYGIRYVQESDVVQKAHFAAIMPATLDFQLLFDGTGVDQIGLLTLFGDNPTVAQRIEKLLALCYHVNGDSHEPNYLQVTWGKFLQVGSGGFRGRLSSLQIAYQSFDRDGSPLRAQLDVSVTADDDLERQKAALALKSPDVTHSRMVRAGDSLPQMSREIYGSPSHVAEVARANDLDQFRVLRPGSELVFPPIAK